MWLGTSIPKARATANLSVPDQDECAVIPPLGEPCLHRWQKFCRKIDWEKFQSSDKKEEKNEESDREVDIEGVKDNQMRTPLSCPKYPPKVLIF